MKQAPTTSTRWILAAALTALLAGCSIPAKLAHPTLRDDVPLAGLQTANRAGWPDAQWWKVYNDPQLDNLIELAMKQSPDLAQAHSRVQNAEQNVRVAAAQAGLTINGSAQVTRQRLSEHGMIPPQFLGFTWYNQADLGVQFDYDFDWWGKKKSAIDAALDQAHAAEAQHSAAALTIQNAVADTYFGWLADHARLQLADQAISTQERLLRIAQLRVRQGVDLSDTVQQSQAQLSATRQMRVALDGSGKIRLAALAALVGVSQTELPALSPRPLPEIKSGLPEDARLDLVARRPDIAASRWQVESALKQTDEARAQFYPDFSVSAMVGLSSTNQGGPNLPGLSSGGSGDLGNIFSRGSRVFGLTPALHLPIFEGGRLQAAYGVSRAQLDAAIAQYNSTVTDAARDVATQALSAEQLAARRDEQTKQIEANQHLVGTAQARARQGVRDAREQLAATAQLLQLQDSAVSLHAQALSTDLSLIKALGGGYRQTPDTTASTSTPSTSSGDATHERQ
jgi:multidrug efflux system outer membrane protein